MDEPPVNRPSNLFTNQGYMMRLAGQNGVGFMGSMQRRRRQRRSRSQVGGRMMGRRRRQKGGVLPLGMSGPAIGMAGPGIKIGEYLGKKIITKLKKNKKKKT